MRASNSFALSDVSLSDDQTILTDPALKLIPLREQLSTVARLTVVLSLPFRNCNSCPRNLMPHKDCRLLHYCWDEIPAG